ncbi:MAG: glycosyltransferase, partial [Verrucomicrobiota bacterium]
AELVNSVSRFSSHDAFLLCEKDINRKIADKIDDGVQIIKHVFKPTPKNHEILYDMDRLVVVNSDSYSFSKLDYWEGRTEHHEQFVDVSRFPQLTFLYNFVISPARNLHTISAQCPDVRMICANQKFLEEIETREKFTSIRILPRFLLESPIDPGSISHEKTPSAKIRIGRHSKSHGYKFNEETAELIERINTQYPDKVSWDFLGVPSEFVSPLARFDNVTVRREYSISVLDYLVNIDIFLFFISWGRNEPWSRAVAEGMMSGCPILATDRAGNRDQVMHGNNGFLCKSIDEFEDRLGFLIDHPDLLEKMRRNNIIYSRGFTTEVILRKFIDFVT